MIEAMSAKSPSPIIMPTIQPMMPIITFLRNNGRTIQPSGAFPSAFTRSSISVDSMRFTPFLQMPVLYTIISNIIRVKLSRFLIFYEEGDHCLHRPPDAAGLTRVGLLPGTDTRACHSERGEESTCRQRFFAALRMTGLRSE